jgi:hypothetical protein
MRCITVTELPDEAVAAFRKMNSTYLLVIHINLVATTSKYALGEG